MFDVNEPIYDSLRQKGMFYYVEPYPHRYPVCWRCGTELVFRLVDEWFIRMGPIRDLLMRVTENIRWVPEFGKARELDWLRNMDDWMISKKRYYGLALPIYKCDDCDTFEIMGSEDELRERAVEGWEEFEGHSPHRPWIDAVKIQCNDCGEKLSRIRDVGNPWLDAGIVSFSTLEFRNNPDYWKEWFPADWISESFPGQFRNWFYSLLTMGAVLQETEPFKLVFSYALMRDENGEEMHKSQGNAIWFEDAAESMGVDAMRWTFARHHPANNINFGFGTADEVRRRFIIPLWNVYSFFVTYANIDRYDPAAVEPPPVSERPDLDRWILSELHQLITDVTHNLENFDPDGAARRAEEFVESLSNWYVRRSRRRFWKSGLLDGQNGSGSGEDVTDKLSAYATLYDVLLTLTKLLAPVIPFVTDAMFRNLVNYRHESVHLEDYPAADLSLVDERLNEVTRLAQRVSSMGRAARSRAQIKVRQPLEKVLVRTRSASERDLLPSATPQILDELNVRTIEVADETDLIEYVVQPNLPLLGPLYGRRVGEVRQALTAADTSVVAASVNAGQSVTLGEFELEPEHILVTTEDKPGLSVSTDAGYTVAVTTNVTPELLLEGQARELVHRIQNMRRDAGFDIADHIVTYYTGDDLDDLLAGHGEYVRQETLSSELIKTSPPQNAHTELQSFDGLSATIGLVVNEV